MPSRHRDVADWNQLANTRPSLRLSRIWRDVITGGAFRLEAGRSA